MISMVGVSIILLVKMSLVISQSNGLSQTNILNGKHLKIATAAFEPYVYIDHDKNGNLTRVYGFVNELVLWLSSKYNFTFDYVESSDGFYGAFVNNSWNGMVKMLIDNEADMIAFCLTPTYARTRVIDFVVAFGESPLAAMIPPPTEDGKIIAVIKPYKIEVWVLIVSSMVCVALITWMTMNFTQNHMKLVTTYQSELKFSRHFLIAFGIISGQGQYLSQKVPHSTRVTASVWCLTSVVLVYLYSGSLISFLSVPKMHPVVETLDELANNTELQILTLKSHFFESYLLEAESGPYLKFGNDIRRYPENRLSNQELKISKLAEKFATRKYVLLLEKTHLIQTIGNYLKTYGICGASLMKEEFCPSSEAFAVPKGRAYLGLLNQGTNIMHDTGFIQYWNQTLNRINKCTSPQSKKNKKISKLSIYDLISVFGIWIAGITVSSIVYAIELLVSHISSS